jgi:hypothetical protein
MGSMIARLFREQKREGHLLLNALRQHWPAVVGEKLGRVTWPLRMEGHTLWVAAKDSAWVYELQFLKAELLDSVRTWLAAETVQDMRFRLGRIPAADAAEAPEADSGATAPVDPAADDRARQLAEAIPESSLRRRFARAYAKRRKQQDKPDPPLS